MLSKHWPREGTPNRLNIKYQGTSIYVILFTECDHRQ